ncbi:50S ribosomal protein L10 [Candidatus Micrarchaeota archaeon]|nr:50S ribosomal protein L10 [Candidatus Micrarchaeota archaeon]
MTYIIDTDRKTIKEKIRQVKEASDDMKKYKTVALLDLRKLPDSLFQQLRKKIRDGGGKVYVLKKPVISRVLQSNEKLKDHVSECKKPVALILTNETPYQINKFFKQNRKKRAAKIGDIAKEAIIVPEGETDLPPGPALSELKAGGINVQIKAGKIIVNKDSTVAKPGEALSAPKVKALQSLGIQPFEIMANMIFGFDGQYVYTADVLDLGDTVNEDLRESLSQALNVSLNANYPTAQNISMLLGEAVQQSMNFALNAEVYSSGYMEQLLISALRQSMALEGMEPKASLPEKPKADEKAGGDTPTAENK